MFLNRVYISISFQKWRAEKGKLEILGYYYYFYYSYYYYREVSIYLLLLLLLQRCKRLPTLKCQVLGTSAKDEAVCDLPMATRLRNSTPDSLIYQK